MLPQPNQIASFVACVCQLMMRCAGGSVLLPRVPQWRYTCHSDASLVVFPLAHDVLGNPLWTLRVMHVISFSSVKLLFHPRRHHSSLLLDVSALASEGVAPVGFAYPCEVLVRVLIAAITSFIDIVLLST